MLKHNANSNAVVIACCLSLGRLEPEVPVLRLDAEIAYAPLCLVLELSPKSRRGRSLQKLATSRGLHSQLNVAHLFGECVAKIPGQACASGPSTNAGWKSR